MTPPLVLACLWVVLSHVLALLPSRDNHWHRACFLIATGLPILGLVTYEHGPWVGLILLVAGMSVLRWPVFYLSRWLRKSLSGRGR